jgi:PAS domain S-box-containing protein
LSALIENSTEAVVSHTLEGAILSWNKGAQRIYGYSAEEVEGKPIMLLSPLGQGAELVRHLETIREGKRPQPFETLHRARNGRTVKALVRISPILDSTRQLIGISFCAQELTDTRVQTQSPSIQ